VSIPSQRVGLRNQQKAVFPFTIQSVQKQLRTNNERHTSTFEIQSSLEPNQ